MLWRAIKLGVLATGGAAVLGGALFGSDLVSYVGSSFHSVSLAVKENIPVEFQIRRARDLLDRDRAGDAEEYPPDRRGRSGHRFAARGHHPGKSIAGGGEGPPADACEMTWRPISPLSRSAISLTRRPQLTQELAQQFASFKEGETALQQKQQLLENRQGALAAANQAMQIASDQRAGLPV